MAQDERKRSLIVNVRGYNTNPTAANQPRRRSRKRKVQEMGRLIVEATIEVAVASAMTAPRGERVL